MKKILVGIDFTEADQLLLDNVKTLAKTANASVTLLHSIPPMAQWVGCYFAFVPQDLAERKEDAKKFTAALQGMTDNFTAEGIQADFALIEEHPGPGIIQFAQDNQIDQIVIGTHSKNRVERALLGSAADHVIRKSPVPILVVPTAS